MRRWGVTGAAVSTRWPPPGVLVKGSESKLEAKETRLQAVCPGAPARRGCFIRPPPRSASTRTLPLLANNHLH